MNELRNAVLLATDLNNVTVKVDGKTCTMAGDDLDCELVFTEDIREYLEQFARRHTDRRGMVLVAVKKQ